MAHAKIIASAPILLVHDVVAAANYYRDRLGFTYERFWGDPACFCIAQRDGIHLMLSQVEDAAHVVPHHEIVEKMWNAYFWVDDVEALYAEVSARGATVDYAPCDQPYGCREFGVQDLDGHEIAFGQEVDQDPDRGAGAGEETGT